MMEKFCTKRSCLQPGYWLLTLFLLLRCSTPPALPPPDADNGGLYVPDGFGVLVVAEGIGRARHIAVNENGDMYVKLRFADNGLGGNVALRDTTGDGKADIIRQFGDYKDEGGLANGITIHDGYLYFSSARNVYRNKLTPGKLIPDSPMETVLTDDHDHGVLHWHITKPIAFDNKGHMFIPFGSPSDACQDIGVGPVGIPGGKGLDPCPELEEHGGVWMFDANKTGLTQRDGKRIATGIRSIVGMEWNADDEGLYAVVHGIDNFHPLFPSLFTAWQGAMLPAETLIKITDGADFGWPYCYYDQMQEKMFLQPGYGGDGKEVGRCSDCDLPLMGFPGHWAPNDLLFYKGNQFPERYKKGVFIAFHGSTDRPPYPQAGYFICFVPFENGKPNGSWEVFADGFTGVDTVVNTSDAVYRPMGLAEGPDGSLYITESNKGKIWRVMYKGDKSAFGETQLAGMEKRKDLSHLKTPDEQADNLQLEGIIEGRGLYNTFCAPCHQRNGKGDGSRFPPLEGSEWVTGEKSRLINVVLNGLEGEIVVNGITYNGLMPPHDFLNDRQLAGILTYVREKFGEGAEALTDFEIEKVRSETIKK